MKFRESIEIEQNKNPREEIMENFYKKFSEGDKEGVKCISSEVLQELKEKGIITENFLDYLCQKHELLLHGSTQEISEGKLKSNRRKIFASNKSAIAIMRSLYSNIGVNLEYPYHIDKDNPLVLQIHTSPNGKFIRKKNGFVYVVSSEGFQNEPKGSWQFVKEADEVCSDLVIETEKTDFPYPVEIYHDLDKYDDLNKK